MPVFKFDLQGYQKQMSERMGYDVPYHEAVETAFHSTRHKAPDDDLYSWADKAGVSQYLPRRPEEGTQQGTGGRQKAVQGQAGVQPQMTQQLPAQGSDVAPERGLFGDIVSRVARGGARAAELGGHALQTLDPEGGIDVVRDLGQGVEEFAERGRKRYDILKPDVSEVAGQEGMVKRGIMTGIESMVPSVSPMLTGGGAGFLVGGPIGAAIGAGAATLGLFGAGVYNQSKEEALEQGLDPDKAHSYGLKQAMIEGGGETASNILMTFIAGPFGKVLSRPIKETVGNLVKTRATDLVSRFALTAAEEVPTEMVQEGLQALVDQKYGMGDRPWQEAVKEAVIPALTMSTLFGLGAQGVDVYTNRKIKAGLNSENNEVRQAAANAITKRLQHEDQELAQAWQNYVQPRINEGLPIPLEDNFVQFAKQKRQDEIVTPEEVAPFDPVDEFLSQYGDQVEQEMPTEDELEWSRQEIKSLQHRRDNLQKLKKTRQKAGNKQAAKQTEQKLKAIEGQIQRLALPPGTGEGAPIEAGRGPIPIKPQPIIRPPAGMEGDQEAGNVPSGGTLFEPTFEQPTGGVSAEEVQGELGLGQGYEPQETIYQTKKEAQAEANRLTKGGKQRKIQQVEGGWIVQPEPQEVKKIKRVTEPTVDKKKQTRKVSIKDEEKNEFIVKEVKGQKVLLPGYEDEDFFISKSDDNVWHLQDGETGLSLGAGISKKDALQDSVRGLERLGGKDALNRAREEADRQGMSIRVLEGQTGTPGQGKPKEPWQMRQSEWVDGHVKSPALHKEHVRQALERRENVPEEVLAEYPDLKKQRDEVPRQEYREKYKAWIDGGKQGRSPDIPQGISTQEAADIRRSVANEKSPMDDPEFVQFLEDIKNKGAARYQGAGIKIVGNDQGGYDVQITEKGQRRIFGSFPDMNEAQQASVRALDDLGKGKGESKEPWQMTQKEFVGTSQVIDDRKYKQHKNIVIQALNEGKPVPEHVLAEYPDLKPSETPEGPEPRPDSWESNLMKARQVAKDNNIRWKGKDLDTLVADIRRKDTFVEEVRTGEASSGELHFNVKPSARGQGEEWVVSVRRGEKTQILTTTKDREEAVQAAIKAFEDIENGKFDEFTGLYEKEPEGETPSEPTPEEIRENLAVHIPKDTPVDKLGISDLGPAARKFNIDPQRLKDILWKAEKGKDRSAESLNVKRISDHFAETLSKKTYKTITQARQEIENVIGRKISPDSKAAKDLEEAIELGVVKRARKIIKENRGPEETFRALVDLYNRQPTLGKRTSTSVQQQAYSTPAPIAYLASRLGGLSNAKNMPEYDVVFDPAAGNGMLLLEVPPNKAAVNELNPQRASNLDALGFTPTILDATELDINKTFSYVIANPPFGRVKEDGQTKTWEVDGYETNEIDHAIALKALQNMAPDGRAVLIVGGKEGNQQQRTEKYRAPKTKKFWNKLLKDYNVAAHYSLSGDLYKRQGAAYPIDVIVIDGKNTTGKPSAPFPGGNVPEVITSFEAMEDMLYERPTVQEPPGVAGTGQPGGTGSGGGVSPGGAGTSEQQGSTPEPGGQEGGTTGEVGTTGGDLSGGLGTPGVRPPGTPGGPGTTGETGAGTATTGQPETGGVATPGGPGVSAEGGQGQTGVGGPGANQPSGVGGTPSSLEDLTIDDFMDEWDKAVEELQKSKGKEQSKEKERTFEDSINDINDILGDHFGLSIKKVSSQEEAEQVSQTLYARLRPLFKEIWERDILPFIQDMREAAQEFIRHVVARMNGQGRPYVKKFIEDEILGPLRSKKTQQQPSAEETEYQTTYVPQSSQVSMTTLIPRNMADSTREALQNLEDRRGNIDEFVAKELNYRREDLHKYFAAEQVDAIGLALDNLKLGRGFIIGDQTGIGKGRVNAAMIKYAKEQGIIPVFVTYKNDLYADMIRDLGNIGMDGFRPFATNNKLAGKEAVRFPDGRILRTGEKREQQQEMDSIRSEGLGEKYDGIFTTYSQLQSQGAGETERQTFFKAIAPQALFILDESHNAGGDTTPKNELSVPRALVIRDALRDSPQGAFYSSATYAKRPDVMGLYFKTDMSLAVDDIDQLSTTIDRGGVPLQQAVAAMLTETGQYIRRERSFAGTSFEAVTQEVDKTQAENAAGIMQSIRLFNEAMKNLAAGMNDDLAATGGDVGQSSAVGTVGIESTNFTSIMHNLIDQYLLALKADAAIDRALDGLEKGEKPIITVANTMGSFLDEYASQNELVSGDSVNLDFSNLFRRYLERSRTLIERDHDNTRHPYYVPDEELSQEALQRYNEASQLIDETDFSKLRVSPIDYIKHRLSQAGYQVEEITGRTKSLQYNKEATKATIQGRPKPNTNEVIDSFNSGELDALIINSAGSTGVSLHSSQEFKDQKKRRMIVAQAEKNIDTFMQILGRVFRTGQVVPPAYELLQGDIPAEKRPAAVLNRKMASLNANTTAGRKTDVTAKDSPDFFNAYGDEIVAQIMNDNRELHKRLGEPLRPADRGEGFDTDNAVAKVTGRIPLLPLEEQTRLYDLIEQEYIEYIEQLEKLGTGSLEARTLPLEAQTIRSMLLTPPSEERPESPFAAESRIEEVSAKRLGKPYTKQQVTDILIENLGFEGEATYDEILDAGESLSEDLLEDLNRRVHAYLQTAEELYPDVPYNPEISEERNQGAQQEVQARRERFRQRIMDAWNSVQQKLEQFYPGKPVLVVTGDDSFGGVVLKIDNKKRTDSPVAGTDWKITLGIIDPSKQVTLPFSKIRIGNVDAGSTNVGLIARRDLEGTLDRFDQGQTDTRENRFIVTGNILAGYNAVSYRGQVVSYTTADGQTKVGVRLPANVDINTLVQGVDVSLPSTDQILRFIGPATSEQAVAKTADKILTVSKVGNDLYRFQVPSSRAKGGKYYLNNRLLEAANDEFVKVGSVMRMNTDEVHARRIIEQLIENGTGFVADQFKDEAKEIVGHQGLEWEAGSPEEETDQPAYSRRSAPVFYSQMQKVLAEKLPNKGNPQQFKKIIQALDKKGEFKGEYKQEELEWSGIEAWLDQIGGKVTKDQVMEFLEANQIQVQEVLKGGAVKPQNEAERRFIEIWETYRNEPLPDAVAREFIELKDSIPLKRRVRLKKGVESTKYGQWQTPGGENYQELLLTLPVKRLSDLPSGYKVIQSRDGSFFVLNEYNKAFTKGHESKEKAVKDFLKKANKNKAFEEERGDFRASHWDEPNVLAHVRFNERTDAEGNRVLFVEEVQSDWHQTGRKKGYENKRYFVVNKRSGNRSETFDTKEKAQEYIDSAPESLRGRLVLKSETIPGAVPNAPFKSTWPMLIMKRMLRYAAENGFDKVAWTPGEIQADRYDMSKHADSIVSKPILKNGKAVKIKTKQGEVIGLSVDEEHNIIKSTHAQFKDKSIEDVLGKELSKKVMSAEGETELSGLDLKVGGHGMKKFYDKMLKDMLNKYVKKWGVKVEIGEVAGGTKGAYDRFELIDDQGNVVDAVQTGMIADHLARQQGLTVRDSGKKKVTDVKVFSLPITESMRESVMQGQPMFQRGSNVAGGLSAADVQKAVDGLKQNWSNAPKINVVQSEADLPWQIVADIQSKGAQGEIEGAIWDGEVYLVSDNLVSPERAEFVTLHESLGHYGLRGIMGDQGSKILAGAYQNPEVYRRARQLAPTYKFNLKTKEGRLKATEEVLANMAAEGVQNKALDRVVDKIREWLRKVFPNLKMTDAEVRNLLARGRGFVEEGQSVREFTDENIKFSRASNYKPKKTIKAYKLFRTLKSKPGEIFPLFIGKTKATPQSEWLKAEFIPTKGFADRPGWHAGILPIAPHLRQTATGRIKPDRVWAEVEIPADKDWQSVADQRDTKDIRDEVPEGGHYRFKTSKMQGGSWIIGGAIKVNRVLSDREVAEILSENGYSPQEIQAELQNPEEVQEVPEIQDSINALQEVENEVLYSLKSKDPLFSKTGKGRPKELDNYIDPGEHSPMESVKRAMNDVKDNWRARALDRNFPIFQKLDQTLGIKEKDQTAYVLHRMLGNQHAVLSTFLEHGKLQWNGKALTSKERKEGFLPWYRALKEDGEKLLYWTAARRAEVLEKEGRENWLTKEARDMIDEWVGDAPTNSDKSWQELSEQLQEWNKNILDVAEQAGLINPASREAWTKDFYIPFYRLFENEQSMEEVLKSPHKVRKFISAQIKQLKGGESKIGNPLENLLHNWSHLINESMRNVARERAFQYGKEIGIIQELSKKDLARMTHGKFERLKDLQVLSYQDGGKPVRFKVHDAELFNALSEANIEVIDNVFMRFFGGAKRALTYGATFGPGFRIANAMRDTLQTAVISKSFKPFVDTAIGAVKAWRQDADYIAVMAAGGGFGKGYVHGEDPKSAAKYINRIVAKEGKGAANRVLSTPAKIFNFWDRIGEASEMAARVQLYANLRKKGASHLEGAYEARDILDFINRGDAKTVQILIQTIPFVNARAQGLYKLGRAAGENPKSFLMKGSMLTAASLALWFSYKDDERYKELETWDRMQYHHFWIGDKHYRIPKAFEVGALFSSIPESIADVLNQNEDTKYLVETLGHTLHSTFAIGMPAVLSPSIEVWANRSFFTDRPIENLGDQRLPAGLRADPWTSETLKTIGEALNLSPKKAEHWLRGHFATFGMFLLGISDAGFNLFVDNPEQPSMTPNQIPGIGRFVRREGPVRYSKQQTEVYEAFDEITKTVAAVRHYAKSGDLEKARALAERNQKALSFYKRGLNKIKTRLSEVRKQQRQIWKSQTLTADQKRNRIDELQKIKNDLFKTVYDNIDKWKD